MADAPPALRKRVSSKARFALKTFSMMMTLTQKGG